MEDVFTFKQVFVIEEINLQSCVRERCNLYLERVIIVVDRNVDTRQTDNFMQAMPSFINTAETRHDTTYFKSALICLYCQPVNDLRKFCQLQVRRHFVGNK